jgi:hypothetical protein
MSRHCQHSSTAKTCAIFAYFVLACSECREPFNYEALCACLSAAGDKAEFLYSKMLQLNSSELVPNSMRMALSYICQKAKTIVVLVVCLSPHGYRQPSVLDSIWSSPGACGRIILSYGAGDLGRVTYSRTQFVSRCPADVDIEQFMHDFSNDRILFTCPWVCFRVIWKNIMPV